MASVLTVGISTLDLIFAVEEFPSKPGKHRAKGLTETGGGNAANSATAIARLGGDAWLLSCIGDDLTGEKIVAELKKDGVHLDYLKVIPGDHSPTSAIFTDGSGERLIMNHRTSTLMENHGDLPLDAISHVDAVLCDAKWISAGHAMMKAAKEAGKISVFDLEMNREHQLDVFLPVATHIICEMESLLEFTGTNDPQTAFETLSRKTDARIAATDGPRGTMMLDVNRKLVHVPAFPVKALDTTGAGDAFHGAAALALAEGQDFHAALQFGSAVAAKKCEAYGARAGLPDRKTAELLLETR